MSGAPAEQVRPDGVSDPDQRAADSALLRRFEPLIRYTRGERFFPDRRRALRARQQPVAPAPRRNRRVDRPRGRADARAPQPAAPHRIWHRRIPEIYRAAQHRPVGRVCRPAWAEQERPRRHLHGRPRPAGSRGLWLALCGRALFGDPAGPRPRAGRHRRGRGADHRADDRREPAPPILRPRGAAGRLGGAAVLVLLSVQQLALGLLWRQRPRGRLGDGLRLSLAGRGRQR